MRIPIFILLLAALSPFVGNSSSYGQGCAAQLPLPTGATDRPQETFQFAEYFQTTGSIPLQGNLAREKFSPVLFSVDGGGLGNFETEAIVYNTSSTGMLSVEAELIARDGTNIFTWNQVDIEPNGHWQQKLFRLIPEDFGMFRVKVLANSEVNNFVGATVYSADAFTNPFDSSLDFFETEVAMVSAQPMQQLQRGDSSGVAYLGPFSTTLESGKDVLNGNFSVVNILNPSTDDDGISLTATITSDNGPTTVVNIPTIPPRGSTQFFGIWLLSLIHI